MTDDKDKSDKKPDIIVAEPSANKNTDSHSSESKKENGSSNNASELFNAKPIPKMSARKSPRNRFWPIILVLLLITTLVFTGWTAYQQIVFQESWSELKEQVNRQIQQQTQSIQQIKTSTEMSLQSVNQAQLQLNQLSTNNQFLKESLLSTQERIKALSGRQKQDWMLAEAAYLIKVAQLQLSLQKNKATAIQLLKSADSLIVEINDNSLLPIREAIAKDISDISLIMEADITGVSLVLNAISQQIPALNIIAMELTPLDDSIPTPEISDDGSFDLSKIYQQFLEDFVVIKDHSEPIKPLMTPEQRGNLNSNIQLAIQQAQIALALGNETLYRLNIDNAISWSKGFFKLDDKTKQIIKQLEEQKLKVVETHYPNKLKAKQALDEISRQQLYQWLDASLSGGSNSLTEKSPAGLPEAQKKNEKGIEQNEDEPEISKKNEVENSDNKDNSVELGSNQ